MKEQVLQDRGYDFIENDPILFGEVAALIGVKASSLPVLIRRRSRRLTEYPVLKLVAKKMGLKPEDLLTAKVEKINDNHNTAA